MESVRLLLDAHFEGRPLPSFDYSAIRPRGEPIKVSLDSPMQRGSMSLPLVAHRASGARPLDSRSSSGCMTISTAFWVRSRAGRSR